MHMDRITPEQRSRVMSRIRGKDTGPELRVRSLVYAMGFRYRLHRRDLPGCPDIVFKGRKKVIFVHGCFWHLHEGCRLNRKPKSRTSYWHAKLEGNKVRDQENISRLEDDGWSVLVVWECETEDLELLERKLRRFLDSPQSGQAD